MSSEEIMEDRVLHKAQRGLFFGKPKFGTFVIAWYKENLTPDSPDVHKGILEAVRDVIKYALDLEKESHGSRTRAIAAFNPNQWSKWYKDDPKLANLDQRTGKLLVEDSQKFLDTGGDVYFLLKSDVHGELEKVLVKIKEKMNLFCDNYDVTKSQPPSKRILQNSFTDGVANPCDTEGFKSYIIKNEGAVSGHPGSTFLLSQKFQFNWTVLGQMDKIQKEDMVGRKSGSDTFIPHTDKRTHIICAHVVKDVSPINVLERHPRVFRVSMPYGSVKDEPSKEEGLMYLHMCNTTEVFKTILSNIAGNDKESNMGEVTVDKLISAVQPLQGTFWYVPSAEELDLPTLKERRFELLDFWNLRSPTNDYLFYNQKEYLYRMTTGGYTPGDPPSDRVLRLLGYAFLQWNDQWFKRREMPKFPHLLQSVSSKRRRHLDGASVMIRKGWAMKVTLGRFLTTNKPEKLEDPTFFGRRADVFSIHPDELIVGRMPPCFSLGLGKRVMPYLRKEEQMPAFVKGLSEAAGFGHVIPDYETLLTKGLERMKQDMKDDIGDTEEQSDFVASCILALEGAQKYIKNFGFLAGYMAQKSESIFSDAQRENLKTIEARMHKIATDRPETFIEAVQLLFSYHCCLHLSGEPVSIGRMDQFLEPFLEGTPPVEAQEIIDCLFVKLCEHVHVNTRLLNDMGAWGSIAVPYASTGMFPNGDTINQWVQQVTVGGYKANDAIVPEDGCNPITVMCLKASRRLPLNAPCLSLRMHQNMPQEVLQEAAKAILSGGSHPVLLHDGHLIDGLLEAGTPDLPVSLKSARNYSCDGCYEPIFPGETDFSLAYVALLQILEMAINHGSTYAMAGPTYLEGAPQSFPTPPPEEITSFEKLKELFALHLRVRTEYNIFSLLLNYGNLVEFCPSPLLSSVMRGCQETKRDIYDGGANYTMIGVQFICFANTVDALYAIKRLCFDHDSAVFSLSEMVRCLKCDWGYNIQEPFHDHLAGSTRGQRLSDTYKEARERALLLPKFGTEEGAENADIKSITSWLAEEVSTVIKKVARDAPAGQPLKAHIDGLKKKYSVPGAKWDVLLPTGSGTFEGYVGWGQSCAASADGRRAGTPIASDIAACITPFDKPATAKSCDVYKSMKCWDMRSINVGFANGAEVGLKIAENFKESDMVTLLKNYADGNVIGGNILTIICANPDTFANAQLNPEKYDLIRVRTGGWNEFYITFFTAHQKHLERRIYYHAP
ncbi:putative dehydratase PflD [Acropora cervicornis]|uniref:Dehydratase PflD n=1 Tax=Acropora cervicornis TaxID=6130 RepID=A0AAD9VDH8_ACRCE|nr:putative dehydratase PflD [Acropora cervicornis]